MGLTDFEWLYGADPGPDGRIAWLSDATGKVQPYVDGRLLPVPGAARRCAWHPGGTKLLVLTDPDGGEAHRLAEVDVGTGRIDWVVAEDGVRCELGVPYASAGTPYSADGKLLAYASNARDPEVFDVLVRDGSGSRIVLRGDDRYLPLGFSPDSRLLLVVKLHQNADHELYVVDLADDSARRITDFTGPAKYQPVGWLPDSSGIVLCTTRGRDHLGLATLSLDGVLTWIDTPEHDVEGGAVRGSRLVWGRNEHGWTRLFWSDGGEARPVLGLPDGVAVAEFGFDGHVPRFTADGRLLVCLARPDAATELYLADLDAGTAQRITDFGRGLPDDLVTPTVVHAVSRDGLRIPCLLYKPHGAVNAPVVLSVHGGPESQARPAYDPLVQALLAQGIGVLAPNYRGSSGYGLTFQRRVYGDWGGGDLEDLSAAAALLAEVDWADETRLGVHGASYGGFAALSCAARLPGTFKAAVSECGTSDLLTDIRDCPPTWRRRTKEWIGDPDDPAQRASMVERSPITHAERVQAPVLMLHGENDTRVNPEESERMYARLKELGKTVRLELHPGIGHEVDREGLADTIDLIVGWFRDHL